MQHSFTMTEHEARLIHQLAASHCAALKNWIVSAVERGDIEEAQKLSKELRAHQNIFAAFNMDAKRDVAEATGQAIATAHTVYQRR